VKIKPIIPTTIFLISVVQLVLVVQLVQVVLMLIQTLSQPPFAELPDCKITLDLMDLNSKPIRPILKVCNY